MEFIETLNLMTLSGRLRLPIDNKGIAGRLFISAKTVDHHISSILFKLDAKSRVKAVQESIRLEIKNEWNKIMEPFRAIVDQ